MGLVLKDCDWIVTQDPQRRVLANASVRIADGRIEQVGRVNPASKDEVIDCRRKVLIPGLINTHTHLSMTLFRGYADDLELRDWLEKKIWPLESRLTGDMCYQGALLGSLEMTRTGTTCFVDMYFHMEDVARAVDEAGLRAILSPGMIDKPDKAGTEYERRTTLKFLEYIHQLRNPLLDFAVGPHAPYTCGPETLLWARDLAEKEDTLVNIHIAETRGEQAQFEKDGRGRVVEYLDKIGFLTNRVLAAHAVWLTKSEVRLLGQKGVRVSHSPVSNMKLASGDMATLDGARCIGLEKEVGSVEIGKRADIVLVDLRDPNLIPIHRKETVVSDLVYSANGQNVDTTIVDGEPLMINRRFQKLDQDKIGSEVRSSIAQLIPQ